MSRQGGRQREIWETRWSERAGPEFAWHLSEPPAELVAVMEGGTVPAGPAVDLGCGDGVATRYIARFLHPVVGVDIALAAARRASDQDDGGGPMARFIVAEVPMMPFQEGGAAFVFDRGCLQHVPGRLWARYFTEVGRLLRPGGVLQLYVSRDDPSAFGMRGRIRSVTRRLRRWAARKGPSPSPRALRRLLPPSMEAVETSKFRFRKKGGKTRIFVYLLARKRMEGAWTSG